MRSVISNADFDVTLCLTSALMVNASGHIEQQLSKLQMQTADTATELEALVDKYLDVLSQASKRQLVLAAYHVCTQVYPENFLDLSLSQRGRLQQNMQELGNRIHAQLKEKWATAKRLSLQPAEEDGLAVIRQLFLEATAGRESSESPPKERDSDNSASSAAETSENSENLTSSKQFQEKLLADVRNLMASSHSEAASQTSEQVETGPMQPAQLMRRHILIEKAIRDVLKAVSENANDILQKAGVMPEIPHALLAATSDSERLGHTPMKTPNLVRLSIKILHEPDKDRFSKREPAPDLNEEEMENEQWPDAEISAAIITGDDSAEDESDAADNATDEPISMPRFLQLDSLPDFVMIHLRLSEIEFAETNVAVWRSRIRKKMAHLKRIGYAYKGAERQLAIAQAEDAWRASWTKD